MSEDTQTLSIKVAWKYHVQMCLALIESETQDFETKQIARAGLLKMGAVLDKLENVKCPINHIDP